ncbi:hypothetical protein D3C80_1824720 [compost metagenome]
MHIDAEGVEQKPPIVFGGVPMLVAVVGAQGAADVQAALAVIASPGDMRKRLLAGGRGHGGGRAGFAGETDATADDQSQAYNVLLHADFPAMLSTAK